MRVLMSSEPLSGLSPNATGFPLILAIHLLNIQVATGVPVPSAAFFNLL